MSLTRALRRSALALVGLCCLLAVAGCGLAGKASGSGGSGGDKVAKPPAGGWPQAQNNTLGDDMCGLLTDADFATVQLDAPLDGKGTSDAANSVFCEYMLGDAFDLYLQPTADAGKLLFDTLQADNTSRLKEDNRTAELATDVVPGVDQSYADLDPLGTEEYPQYQVLARRGALLVRVSTQSGKNTDPEKAVAALVKLVLDRVPDLGKEDNGSTHVVTYLVTGTGTADVSYADFASTSVKDMSAVKLPLKVEMPIALYSADETINLSISATNKSFTEPIGCEVLVDGKSVKKSDPGAGLAFCLTEYKLS